LPVKFFAHIKSGQSVSQRRRSTLHYGILTDWRKKRRTFELGSDLKTTRDEGRNIRRDDCDLQKIQQITFRAWGKSSSQRMLIQRSTLAEWNAKSAGLKRSNLFSQDLLLPEWWNR
jgi:hypothetical protein